MSVVLHLRSEESRLSLGKNDLEMCYYKIGTPWSYRVRLNHTP